MFVDTCSVDMFFLSPGDTVDVEGLHLGGGSEAPLRSDPIDATGRPTVVTIAHSGTATAITGPKSKNSRWPSAEKASDPELGS